MEIADGFHVPAIPLSDVAGKAGTVAPEQNVVGIEKVGTVGGVGVMVSVSVIWAPQTLVAVRVRVTGAVAVGSSV